MSNRKIFTKGTFVLSLCLVLLFASVCYAQNLADDEDFIIDAFLNTAASFETVNLEDNEVYKEAELNVQATAGKTYYYSGLFTGFKTVPPTTKTINHFVTGGACYSGTIQRESYYVDGGSALMPVYSAIYSGYLSEDIGCSIFVSP
jgi:hypothetical protein